MLIGFGPIVAYRSVRSLCRCCTDDGSTFECEDGKWHVEVIQLLPFSLDQQNDNFRENLNNYLKAIYASLILEDILDGKINVSKEKA